MEVFPQLCVLSGVHKNYFKDRCLTNAQPTSLLFDLFLTKWIMVKLSKRCKPVKFELRNSLKLNLANIQGLCSNFVYCESFIEWNCPDILHLFETNVHDLTDSGNFSMRDYLPLIRKDSITLCIIWQFMWRKDFLFHRTYL